MDFCAVAPEEAQTRLKSGPAGLTGEGVERARGGIWSDPVEGERKARGVDGHPAAVQESAGDPTAGDSDCVAGDGIGAFGHGIGGGGGGDGFAECGAGVFFQERRSGKAVEKLQEMVETNCVVLRDGKEAEIPMEEIVPGDLVLLHAGAIIPADLRLLTTKDFFIGQSALTGESMPVEKNAAAWIGGQGNHRADERVFPGKQCHQRDSAGDGGEHGEPDVFRVDFGETGGPAGGDEF